MEISLNGSRNWSLYKTHSEREPSIGHWGGEWRMVSKLCTNKHRMTVGLVTRDIYSINKISNAQLQSYWAYRLSSILVISSCVGRANWWFHPGAIISELKGEMAVYSSTRLARWKDVFKWKPSAKSSKNVNK